MYAELHAHSWFSLLEGACSPRRMVECAAALGYRALALTDRESMSGVLEATEAARSVSLPLIVGATVSLAPWTEHTWEPENVVVLCRGPEGYAALCEALTEGMGSRPGERGPATLSRERLARLPEIFVLMGHEASPLARLVDEGSMEEASELLQAWRCALPEGALLVSLQDHGLPIETRRTRLLDVLAREQEVPTVVTQGALYAAPSDHALQDVLTALRRGETLREAAPALRPNNAWCLRTPVSLRRRRPGWSEAMARTVEVAAACINPIPRLRYALPNVVPSPSEDGGPVGGGLRLGPWGPCGEEVHSAVDESPTEALRRLAWWGAERRYTVLSLRVRQQLGHELALIAKLGFCSYFLIVHDIVRFCHRRGIFAQGRGSAANSVVCYALGITNVDPIGLDLLFERFLSEERPEYPDIDLDIASGFREDVLQYVFETYGREHVAMVCNVVTFRRRLAVREVGRVLGLDRATLDAVGRAVGRRSPDALVAALLEEGITVSADAGVMQRWSALSAALEDVPRHLSIHSGGVVISAEPLQRLVPIEPASMRGRRVLQWDKEAVEAAGLCKIDLLGLGMLEALQEGLQWVRAHQGWEVDPGRLTCADPAVFDRIEAGDTVGVFQVESRAQISSLPRMRPRTFYDLVVQVAIIRPGPIQGEMVHPYLRRRAGEEAVTYLHPDLEPILARTLGVPLFQEQGMKIAVQAAGLTPGRADALRRAMGSKRSQARMEALAQELIEGMARRGVERPVAEAIWKQLAAFANYGFPESHAASFALLVYLSAWMKTYCPEAFLCALLNAQPMGFYTPASLVADAERHGVRVLGLCAQRSAWGASIEGVDAPGVEPRRPPEAAARVVGPGPGAGRALAVRLGFAFLQSAGPEAGARLEAARAEAPFAGPADFAQRSGLSRAALEEAAWAGAFSCWGLGPRDAAWQVAGWLQPALPLVPPEPVQLEIFEAPSAQAALAGELEAMGVAPGRHAVGLFRPDERPDALRIASVAECPDGARVRVFGQVTCRQSPSTAKGFVFLTLEDETGMLNVVVRPPVFEAYRPAVRSAAFLWMGGRVQRGSRPGDRWGLPLNFLPTWIRAVRPDRKARLDALQRSWG